MRHISQTYHVKIRALPLTAISSSPQVCREGGTNLVNPSLLTACLVWLVLTTPSRGCCWQSSMSLKHRENQNEVRVAAPTEIVDLVVLGVERHYILLLKHMTNAVQFAKYRWSTQKTSLLQPESRLTEGKGAFLFLMSHSLDHWVLSRLLRAPTGFWRNLQLVSFECPIDRGISTIYASLITENSCPINCTTQNIQGQTIWEMPRRIWRKQRANYLQT